jgi:hypothetical protein
MADNTSLLNQQLDQVKQERPTGEKVQGYMGHKDSDKVSSQTRVDMRTITTTYGSGSQGRH